jgi:hypothetical protein
MPARPRRHDHFPSSPKLTSSTTAAPNPSSRAHTLPARHVSTAPMDSSLREAGTLAARRRAHRLNRSPHPRKQHKRPKRNAARSAGRTMWRTRA